MKRYKLLLPVAFLLSLVSLGQVLPNDLQQRIERQLRVTYELPESVKLVMSPLRASEFPNYDALTITIGENKKTYEFLLSKDQKTLIRMTKLDLSKDPYAETMKKIDITGRPVRGNPNAKVVVVNYDDFECPFCSRAHNTLFPELLKEYGDKVAFVYKDFPLSDIHPWAIHAAVDANCLASQSDDAYWDFADYIHKNQGQVNSESGRQNQFAELDRITQAEGGKFNVDTPKLQACMKAQKEDVVRASMKEGDSLGIDGTPTMFVNGELVNGARTADEFRAIFDAALQRAGVPVPSHPASQSGTSSSSAAAPPAANSPH
ncbi:MAG TPA: thioredoxin domain-containing protein [Terriglobales bacterium]|nr:thioredoxin domain-containing protein [Terriglobales bacterium]